MVGVNQQSLWSSYPWDVALETMGGISSGDSGGHPVSLLFQGVVGNDWESSAPCTSGATYCGANLGAAFRLRRFFFVSSGSATFSPNLISIQYSDDGSAWTTIAAGDTSITTGSQTLNIADNGAHQYWRFLARQSTAGVWSAFQLSMYLS